MINFPDIILIGLGHKARNGKDTVANLLKEKLDNVEIVHWADGVYEECRNLESEFPLIKREFKTSEKTYYSVLKDSSGDRFAISDKTDPFLHDIFEKRGITEYQRMIDKDPEILQFWGTNYRRTHCDKDYWVKFTMKKVNKIAKHIQSGYILIPDTRFKNEVDAVRLNGGYYVKVVRTTTEGNQYISEDRDPNHMSEIDLNDYPADVTLTALNVPELAIQVEEFIRGFLEPIKMAQAFKK